MGRQAMIDYDDECLACRYEEDGYGQVYDDHVHADDDYTPGDTATIEQWTQEEQK